MKTKIYYLLIVLLCSVAASAQFKLRPPGKCVYLTENGTACKNIEIGDIEPGVKLSNFTIEFWMNADVLLAYGPNFGAENDQTAGCRFRFTGGGAFNMWTTSGTTANKFSLTDTNTKNKIKEAIDKQWAHIAITYAENATEDKAILYINGEQIGTSLLQNIPAPSNGFSGFKIGTSASVVTEYFNRRLTGRADEFRIWTTTRSQDEIRTTMNSELDGSEPGLLIYYNFNEDTGVTVTNKATAQAGKYNGTIKDITDETHFFDSDAFIQEGVLTSDFSVTPVAGTSPHTVSYADASIGNPTNWEWTFPGGTPASSTEQNPTITYSTPGTYNATLRTYNSNYEHSVTKEDIVWASSFDGGKALALDGVDDYMIVPDIFTDTERLSAYTVEFWMNQKSLGAYQTAQIRGGSIFNSFNFGIFNEGQIYTGFDEETDPLNNPETGLVTDSTCYIMSEAGTFEINKWHHYAITFGNSTIKLYKNGELVATDMTTANDGPSWNDSITYHKPGGLHIGSPLGGDKTINGYIDEFRVWSVERSQEEIINSLKSDVAANTPGLEVYYKFDDGDIVSDTLLVNKANATQYTGRLRNFTQGSEFVTTGAFSLDPDLIPSIPTNIVTNAKPDFPAHVFVTNNQLTINIKNTDKHSIIVYSVTGQAISKQDDVYRSYTTSLPSKGLYIVAIKSEDNKVYTTKVIN